MGKRLYLSKGFVAGTLTKEEEMEAKNNSIVMQEIRRLEKEKANKRKTKTKKKVVKNG